MPYELIALNGTQLNVEDRSGEGTPIVFSHGLLWCGAMFAAQIEHFAGRHRTIAYDHRGQGGSPPSPGPYDMDTLAGDAAELIEKLGAAPCHFVGLSMGGFVGQRLAIRRPELLRSLTLIDTAADAEPRLNIPRYRAMSLVTRVFGYRPLLGAVMNIMFARAFRSDPAREAERRSWERHLLALRDAPTREALGAVIERKPVQAELGKIRTPTLVIHGAEDKAIVPARARRMADAIPGARWVTIPRAGHSSTIEEPAAVSRAIGEFLAVVG